MRTHKSIIPAAYQLLDTHVNEANSFANTRDLKKLRDNHNILLARRCKHTILSSSYRESAHATDGKIFYNALTWTGDSLANALVSCPVIISSKTQKIRLNVYARKTSNQPNTNVILSPVIHAMGESPPQVPEVATYAVTINNTAYAWYTVDFPVPKMSQSAMEMCMFTLIFYGGAFAPEEGIGPYAIVDSGPDWIVSSFGGMTPAQVTNMVITTSDGVTTPRMIRRAYTYGANIRAYIEGVFNRIPRPGTDTIDLYYPKAVQIESLCLYEMAISSAFAPGIGGA